jgi:FlaA1/EpsC-like NDP-sugar epimerase
MPSHLRNRQHLPLLRDVTVEDLLGRQAVKIDDQRCRSLVAGKVVLVTGAAGSIGSEICRQVLAFGPRRLIMLDNNESGLYDLQIELSARNTDSTDLHYIIASITDRSKIDGVFRRHTPAIVFHAAAYKHVPLMESFPEEAVRVNVGGTVVLLECAERYNVARFVLISTDKAVDPQNVMGATKRIGELLTLSAGQATTSRFTAVRFGNVLNSRGSVVPTFEKQIEMGGPVTVTDPDMKRFFMSIPEAVSLVIEAATLTKGNDLFMLEMGEEISISSLAQRMIRLRGLRVDHDIHIRYTGTRPGEKLRESLNAPREAREPTEHPAIYRLTGSTKSDNHFLREQINELLCSIPRLDSVVLRERIFAVLETYETSQHIARDVPSENQVGQGL